MTRDTVRTRVCPISAPLSAFSSLAAAALLSGATAFAAPPGGPGGPPAVGVQPVGHQAVTASSDYIGRIQAIDRVALVPRVTAYLDKRLFDEGAEVKKGDLLYVLEQAPFQAAVLAQQGALEQAQSTVANAGINFARQKALLSTPAGQKQSYDNALASARGGAAAVISAQANLQTAQIQLGYTEIRAPVDGRISATAVNEGNVVSPSTGTLATIVTQDPMYVTFPAASRDVLSMQKKYQDVGGLSAAAIKLTLGDGTSYDQAAKLDYVAPTVSENTDTITLRATVANPKRGSVTTAQSNDGVSTRQLVDGEFVTVTVADPHPVDRLVIPRAAVLSDQEGDYVFLLAAGDTAKRADLKLGETVGANAVVLSGLKDGDQVIVDGIQKLHDGAKVSPGAPQRVVPDPGAKAAEAETMRTNGSGDDAAKQGGTAPAGGGQH